MNSRYDLINHFIRERGFKSFLEIGTENGTTFRAVECPRKVSVDPNEAHATFQLTSDEFFHRNTERFDIVFVDGFHEWHQALRDVNNALNVLDERAAWLMHDALGYAGSLGFKETNIALKLFLRDICGYRKTKAEAIRIAVSLSRSWYGRPKPTDWCYANLGLVETTWKAR